MPVSQLDQVIEDPRLVRPRARTYAVAFAMVTTLRWLIINPINRAQPTPPTPTGSDTPLRGDSQMRQRIDRRGDL